jgi:hypothetical protein
MMHIFNYMSERTNWYVAENKRLRARIAELEQKNTKLSKNNVVQFERIVELERAWEKNNLCGICPYRQAIQAHNEKLEKALLGVYWLLRAGEVDNALHALDSYLIEHGVNPETLGYPPDPGPLWETPE